MTIKGDGSGRDVFMSGRVLNEGLNYWLRGWLFKTEGGESLEISTPEVVKFCLTEEFPRDKYILEILWN